MLRKQTSKTQILITSFLLFCGFIGGVNAGHIDVINQNKKSLKIKIQTEESVKKDAISYLVNIPAEEYSSFTVETADLKGKPTYSIEGETNLFTSGDTCHRLSVEKDYKVTFLNDTSGTTCIAEEIGTPHTEKGNTMSKEKLSGKWAQVVGKIKEKWGDLTDQDLEKVKGKKDQLVGLIQQKYGETKEEVEKKINDLLDKIKD